jgi:hypothetical protein
MMIDRDKLEQDVAALIREHAAIGYSFKNGQIDAESLFISAEGAAHVVVHHVLRAASEE